MREPIWKDDAKAVPKKRWLAGLLAFIVPGAGHIYAGYYARGLLLLAAVFLDISALIRFSDSTGGSRALLLVYLGLTLPVLYFISVYDALQKAAAHSDDTSGGARGGSVPQSVTPFQGAALIGAGALLLFLIRPPAAVQPRIDLIGDYASGAGLLIIGALLIWYSRGHVFLLGRWSASALIIFVGILLLWDQVKGRNDISILGQWWPAVLIAVGLEITAYSLLARRRHLRLGFDIAGVFIAFLIASTAFAITQYGGLPFRWLDQWNTGMTVAGNLGEEKGYEYIKNEVTAVPEEKVKAVVIDNPNGEIKVVRGSGASVTVKAEVWVDLEDKQEADKIAEASNVKIESGEKIVIEAKGKPYGANGERKPRMNITVLLPDNIAALAPLTPGAGGSSGTAGTGNGSGESDAETPTAANGDAGAAPSAANQDAPGEVSPQNDGDQAETEIPLNQDATGTASPSIGDQFPRESEASGPEGTEAETEEQGQEVEMNVNAGNGPVSIAGLRIAAGLSVNNINGLVQIRDIDGPVTVQTAYGDITADNITGDAKLSTKDGNVKAKGIGGSLSASTSNGSLELEDIDGNADAETKNGKISIIEVRGNVQADTLNGEIDVGSAVVGGSWDVDSSIGEIRLRLPESGDYSVNGSVTFGAISSNLPLKIEDKTVQGSIGLGTHRINVDANSDIAINRY